MLAPAFLLEIVGQGSDLRVRPQFPASIHGISPTYRRVI